VDTDTQIPTEEEDTTLTLNTEEVGMDSKLILTATEEVDTNLKLHVTVVSTGIGSCNTTLKDTEAYTANLLMEQVDLTEDTSHQEVAVVTAARTDCQNSVPLRAPLRTPLLPPLLSPLRAPLLAPLGPLVAPLRAPLLFPQQRSPLLSPQQRIPLIPILILTEEFTEEEFMEEEFTEEEFMEAPRVTIKVAEATEE